MASTTRKSARLNFRLASDLKRVIEEAASQLGQSISDFAVSTLVQAMLHGLAMQTAADPEAVDAEEIIAELDGRLRMRPAVLAPRHASLSLKEQVKGASQKLESEIILRTLERHRWNRRRAAQSLKISYRSLLYKMKNCNLRVEAQATPEGE